MTEEWKKRFDNLFNSIGFDHVESYREKPNRVLLHDFISQQRKEAAKAYGGCELCYGKGYSTEQQGAIGNSRVTLRGPQVVYNPCSCDRGKQFEEAMKSAAREALEAARREIEKEYQDEHPTEDGVPVETYGYEATHNQALKKSLSIIKKHIEEL